MKAIVKIGMWKTIVFLAIIFCLFSCNSCDDPIPPVILNKAIAVIQPAANIKINAATLVARVTPNEDGSKAAFEIKESSKSTWSTHVLPSTYSGKDTIRVILDFYEFKANTSYDFRIKVVNEAGESVSEISSFETYAVTDYDGNYYHTVTIGTQTWLRENFKGTHFANGDPIPNITGQTEWEASTTPAYCYYNNDSKNAETYGALYNWYVAKDPRGLIIGYHTPSYEEWVTIDNYLGGSNVSGGKMKETGFTHWLQPNEGATNSSNLTVLPAGVRQKVSFNGKGFIDLYNSSAFWSSSIFFGMTNVACVVTFESAFTSIQHAGDYLSSGFSLRVIKN